MNYLNSSKTYLEDGNCSLLAYVPPINHDLKLRLEKLYKSTGQIVTLYPHKSAKQIWSVVKKDSISHQERPTFKSFEQQHEQECQYSFKAKSKE